jgi:hypothetical protein
VTRWAIRLPTRGPRDSPVVVGDLARHLKDPDDRAVTRELALLAAQVGVRYAEDMAIVFSRMTGEQRRHAINLARTRAGLKTLDEVEAAERAAALREQGDRLRWQQGVDGVEARWGIDGRTGLWVDLNQAEAEAERGATEDAIRQERHARAEAERAEGFAEARRDEAARAEMMRAEFPPGMPSP